MRPLFSSTDEDEYEELDEVGIRLVGWIRLDWIDLLWLMAPWGLELHGALGLGTGGGGVLSRHGIFCGARARPGAALATLPHFHSSATRCRAPQDAGLALARSSEGVACTELPGGRKRWQRCRYFLVDPWCDECHNVAACTETVEVVPAAAG